MVHRPEIITEKGRCYLLKCCCDERYQLGIGNIVLRMDEQQLSIFQEALEDIPVYAYKPGLPNNKEIVLRTDSECTMLAMDRNEVFELTDFLAEALLQIQVQKLTENK